VKAAVSQGELSVAAAKRIVSVITPENKSEWIEKAKELKPRELDRRLPGSLPPPPKPWKRSPFHFWKNTTPYEKRSVPRKENPATGFKNSWHHSRAGSS
jgi:hypothetical protein